MKRKSIAALALAAVMTLGVGASSYAWFTSQSTSTGNYFKSGTLTISAPGVNKIAENVVSVSNIYPGWEQQKTITIKNDGTLPFKYRVSATSQNNNILYNGSDGIKIKVNDGEFMNINELQNILLGTIKEGGSKDITFTFKLPEAANNDYKGLDDNFGFVFDAAQIEDVSNGWQGMSLVKYYDTGKNDENRSFNRPYINYTVNGNNITLEFKNPTNYAFAFDYRVDGEQGTLSSWANTVINQGELAGQTIGASYHIVNVAAGQTVTKTVTATEEVWAGLRLGAEQNYFLDWIKFAVK